MPDRRSAMVIVSSGHWNLGEQLKYSVSGAPDKTARKTIGNFPLLQPHVPAPWRGIDIFDLVVRYPDSYTQAAVEQHGSVIDTAVLVVADAEYRLLLRPFVPVYHAT